jgi:hypothetical protein
MSFLLSLILFIITAILICASLKIPTRVGFLIGLFVTAYANMLLIAQITGIIGLLSNKAIWISLNGLSVALAGWFWQHSGRPHLIGAFAKVQINAHPIRALLEKLI